MKTAYEVRHTIVQDDEDQLNHFAEMIREQKPYLLELEKEVGKIGYGTVEVKLEVRAGAVEKMCFFNSKNWLRPKSGHIDTA